MRILSKVKIRGSSICMVPPASWWILSSGSSQKLKEWLSGRIKAQRDRFDVGFFSLGKTVAHHVDARLERRREACAHLRFSPNTSHILHFPLSVTHMAKHVQSSLYTLCDSGSLMIMLNFMTRTHGPKGSLLNTSVWEWLEGTKKHSIELQSERVKDLGCIG